MTTVMCNYCSPPRRCGGPAGLASHIRANHPEELAPVPGRAASMSVPPPSESDGLVWEDPPPKGGSKIQKALQAAVALFPRLRRNAGRWARIIEFDAQSTAFGQVKKLRDAHPDLEFEARSREHGSAIWARYVEAD